MEGGGRFIGDAASLSSDPGGGVVMAAGLPTEANTVSDVGSGVRPGRMSWVLVAFEGPYASSGIALGSGGQIPVFRNAVCMVVDLKEEWRAFAYV